MKLFYKLCARALKYRPTAFVLKTVLFAFISCGVIAGLSIGPAFALLVDQTRIFNQRSANQKLTYYRITVNFNDQNIGSAQQFGELAPNSYIYAIDAYVNTAFNAATTNVITIGTTKTSSNEIVASGITAGTPGVYHLTSAAGLGTAVSMGGTWLGLNMPLFVKYAQTGTAATTGQVVIIIAFATNDDM